MSEVDDQYERPDPTVDEVDVEDLDDGQPTGFDQARADYEGIDLDDEFQPVDTRELREEGAELDDQG
jgi:hypothetical protein